MQGLRNRVLAGDAARRADGVVRRRLRGLLPVRRHQEAGGGVMNVIPIARARRRLGTVSVRTVTLAHGGGGKAMKDLIDDVFVRAFDNARLAPLEDQARIDLAESGEATATGSRSLPTASSSIRCFSPAATSASSPSAEPSMISRSAVQRRFISRARRSSRKASRSICFAGLQARWRRRRTPPASRS